jgi:hypothetical protein
LFKIICNTCGEEINLIKPDDKEERTYDEEDGWYVTEDDGNKFYICGEHDQIWITCNGCGTRVWMFT